MISITTDSPGSVQLNGGLIKTTGAQTYNDAAILGANTTVNGTNVTFASTINGAKSLTINDGGKTYLNGTIGGVNPLTNLTVNTTQSLQLPSTSLTSNLQLNTTGGNVSQAVSASLYVGGTTNISASGNITLDNSNNDFVGSITTKGTNVTLSDINNMYLGQNEATAGSVTLNAGQSIYNSISGSGTNIISTAASILRGNNGTVGTFGTPISVRVPSVYAYANQMLANVSVAMIGTVGDNTIHELNTPPGLVFLNGCEVGKQCIINPGQLPGVPQNAYSTSLAVLDQYYLSNSGLPVLTGAASVAELMNGNLYPTDDNVRAVIYGPLIYKLSTDVKIINRGVKMPAELINLSYVKVPKE